MKAMIKVGRWSYEYKHAAAVILNKGTYYFDAEDTYEGIKHVDLVPNLSLYNLEALQINKDFMLSHGYIENDFDEFEWAAPEFLQQATKKLLEEEWQKCRKARLPEATSLEDGRKASRIVCVNYVFRW